MCECNDYDKILFFNKNANPSSLTHDQTEKF